MTNTENQEYQMSLRMEYTEVSANFRKLAEIRFKLLAFLPIGTAVGVLYSKEITPMISLFGLVVTLALMTYNARNDQHYDELVSRAAEIERKLGLYHGNFNQRPISWFTFRIIPRKLSFFISKLRFFIKKFFRKKGDNDKEFKWTNIKVSHGGPITLIYKASIVAWSYGFLRGIISCNCNNTYRYYDELVCLLIPTIIVLISSCFIYSSKKKRRKHLIKNIKQMIKLVSDFDIPQDSKIKFRNRHLLKRLCLIHFHNYKVSKKNKESLEKKLAFYFSYSQLTRPNEYFPIPDSESTKIGVHAAVHIVSLLTDLPARWIMDIYSGRKGN